MSQGETTFLLTMLLIVIIAFLALFIIHRIFRSKEKTFENEIAEINSTEKITIDGALNSIQESITRLKGISEHINDKANEINNLNRQLQNKSAEIRSNMDPVSVQFKQDEQNDS